MARGRAKWKRALDAKPHLTRAMRRLELSVPSLTAAIGYHSIMEAPSRFLWLTESRLRMRMTEAPYADAFRALGSSNVDSPTWQLGHPGHAAAGGVSEFGALPPLETRRVASIVPDVLVPGHTLCPVDGRTQRLLLFYGSRVANWGDVFPAASRLRTVRIDGVAWAVPPLKNYFHLLVEHILPVVDVLLRQRERLGTNEITVIAQPAHPLLAAIAGLLERLGITVRFEDASPFATYAVEQYLFAKPVSASVEHYYAYPEAVAALREAFPGTGSATHSARLYIPRTGTRIRRLVGETALIEQLTQRGFDCFTAHRGNPEEQFARFMSAREIVSVHGAALTNVIWAEKRANVVEIFPSNARKTTYLHMASQHGHAYAHVSGGRENDRQDFSVDPQSVLRALA